MRNALNDSIEQLNFANDPDQSREHINHFIEEGTKNHIKNFLRPNEITMDTILAIVNAAYFNGQWVWCTVPWELLCLGLETMKFNYCIHLQLSVFDKRSTAQKKFYKHDGEVVNVDMMKQLGFFKYGKFWLMHLMDQSQSNIFTVSNLN